MQLQRVPGEPDRHRDDHPELRPSESSSDALARALEERGVVLLSGRLDDAAASRVAAAVLTRDKGDRPLTVHVSNTTGSVGIALMLHDVIAGASVEVHTIGGGLLDTAGALVLAAGAPSHRELLPSARIHLTRIDEPETPDLDVERGAEEVQRLRGAASSVLGTDLDRPRVLSAEEAVAAGLADSISLRRK